MKKELSFSILNCRIFIRFIIAISVLLSNNIGSAQNTFIDDTRKKLEVAKDDTSRVLLLSQISNNFLYVNIDSTKYYASEGLALARQINYLRGEANAQMNLGTYYREKGELPKALETQLSVLKIADKYGFPIEKGVALRRIGMVYMDLNNFPKSIENYWNAIYTHQQIKNSPELGYDYLVAAWVYTEKRDPDSAWYFIQKAGEIIDEIRNVEPEFYLWRGNIYWLERKKDSALSDWNQGLRLGLPMGYYRTSSNIYYHMGEMYWELKQPESSIFYAKQGLEYAKRSSREKVVYLTSNLLFKLYDSLNHPAEALFYFKIASAANDSLLGAGNIKTIGELIAHEESRQKEIETERESYQSRLRQIMLATGLGAFFIIAIILYRNNRKKQKTNIILAKQKAEIQETLTKLKSTQSQLIQSEKMASLGELTAGIAHEIQNPLNFVNNFSEVNTELLNELKNEISKGNLGEANSIAENIISNENKISQHGKRADAIVKGMLQHSRTSTSLKEPVDINALADEYFRLAYHGYRAKDPSFKVSTDTQLDPSTGKIAINSQDIGRVLLNLLNNAFYSVGEQKKVANGDYEPKVSLITTRHNGKVEIIVMDNGTGIPTILADKIFQPFFTTKPAGQGTGLGLSLSYDIISKGHGGTILVESKVGEGASFTIQLPQTNS